MSLTPREAYEQMKNGGEITGMDAIHSALSKTILTKQADWVSEEESVDGYTVTEDGAEPWVLTLTFSDGDISGFAQNRLSAMRQNAHKTEMVSNGEKTTIRFYVYTIEDS